MIDNALLKEYLEGWLDNVGRSFDDDETIANAMSCKRSLHSWGLIPTGISDVDYDYEYALKIINKNLLTSAQTGVE